MVLPTYCPALALVNVTYKSILLHYLITNNKKELFTLKRLLLEKQISYHSLLSHYQNKQKKENFFAISLLATLSRGCVAYCTLTFE